MTDSGIARRALLTATGAAAVAAAASGPATAQQAQVVGREYWAQKGEVKLHL
jgi:hypothetical protein